MTGMVCCPDLFDPNGWLEGLYLELVDSVPVAMVVHCSHIYRSYGFRYRCLDIPPGGVAQENVAGAISPCVVGKGAVVYGQDVAEAVLVGPGPAVCRVNFWKMLLGGAVGACPD